MRFPYKGAGIALFYSDTDDYILLGLRSDYPFHKRWSVPGGFFEKSKDSDAHSNALREFREETGICLDSNAEYVGKTELALPFFNWTTFIYSTNTKSENFIPDEFYELRWIKIKDLNRFRLRPFTRREVRTFYKARR